MRYIQLLSWEWDDQLICRSWKLLSHSFFSFQFSMRVDEQCKVLCKKDGLSKVETSAFKKRIDEDYRVNMYENGVVLGETKGFCQRKIRSYLCFSSGSWTTSQLQW